MLRVKVSSITRLIELVSSGSTFFEIRKEDGIVFCNVEESIEGQFRIQCYPDNTVQLVSLEDVQRLVFDRGEVYLVTDHDFDNKKCCLKKKKNNSLIMLLLYTLVGFGLLILLWIKLELV